MATTPDGASERPGVLEESLLARLGGAPSMSIEELQNLAASNDPVIAPLARNVIADRLSAEIADSQDIRSTRRTAYRGLRVLVNTKAIATGAGLLVVLVAAGASGYECVEAALHHQGATGAVFGFTTVGSGGVAYWIGKAIRRRTRHETSGGPDGT